MWVAKIRLKHDCIYGNRCKKFGVKLQTFGLENNPGRSATLHYIFGDPKNIKAFLADIKKEKSVSYLEAHENMFYIIENHVSSIRSAFTTKMFFLKPMIIDTDGAEYGEVGCHEKEELMKFIRKIKPDCTEFKLLSMRNTKLKDIYFAKALPNLTELQKQALSLAISNGYYSIPKKIGLRDLAKIMGVSLSTYQQHLQTAESKVMPDVLSYTK